MTLPVTGTYRLVVDPASDTTGQLSLQLHTVPDNTGTITVDGPPVTVTVTDAGQNPTRSFSATAGDVLTLDITHNSVGQGYVYLAQGSGTLDRVVLDGPTARLAQVRIYATGTYQVLIDPYDQSRGTMTLSLHH